MARSKVLGFLLLVFFSMVLLSVAVIQGCRANEAMLRHSIIARREQWFQGKLEGEDWNLRRLMIGSTMPMCTYNECRGCRFRCRAEQAPVEGNDPIHSAYHYRRRTKSPPLFLRKQPQEKSEWWTLDGEIHVIGENTPPRERFVIPRDNIPNKRRKQLREQFMRRTRLVLKESEHEPWCKRYMELYNELGENWERLHWDEGYSKKLARDHVNYESAEDDDQDFNPYRSQRSYKEQVKTQGFVSNPGDDSLQKVNQIRDKFEYDRERRMRDKAFAPMNLISQNSWSKPFDAQRYFSGSESDS